LPALAPGTEIQPLKYLTPQESAQAQQLAKTIDVRDALAVTSFAAKPQKEMTALTDPIMKIVATKDTGAVGEVLTNLMTQVKELNASSFAAQSETWLAQLPVVGAMFSKVQHFISQYEKIGTKIDRIVIELESSKNTLNRDIALLDQLFAQNSAYFRQLLVFTAAGEMKLQELRPDHEKLAAQARAANDPVLAQQVSDLGNAISRLERRVYDLKLTTMIALQTAPQIRLVQNGDQALVEKIQTSIMTTIPLWKNQIIIAITLFDQKKGVELQRAVADTTNELLLKNAEMLQQGSAAVARETERGVVEIQTLQTVNQRLIDTIEETLQIQVEGRQKRQEAEGQLEQMQKDLKNKLTEIRSR
jgi:uncharacterized protein YaaN involved in tellurite resistance